MEKGYFMRLNYRTFLYLLTLSCMIIGISNGSASNNATPSPMVQPMQAASSQPSLQGATPPQLTPIQPQMPVPQVTLDNPSKRASDALFVNALRDIFQTFLHMNPDDFKQKVCGSNCQNVFVQPFLSTINQLRYFSPAGDITQQVINNTIQQLMQIQNRLSSFMRDRKLPLRAYIITELAEDTKERLKKGDRIYFPRPDQLQNIDPTLLTKADVELLFFQKTIELERSQSTFGSSAINYFRQQHTQWIQYIHQTHHQHLRSHMDTLLNRVYDRLQNDNPYADILNFIHNALPEQERNSLPLPSDQKDPDLLLAEQFLNEIKNVKETYTDKPFDDDSKNTMKTKDVQNFLESLTRVQEYDTRKKTLESIQRHVDQFLIRLPETNPLKKDKNLITRTVTDAANQEPLDIGRNIFDKSSKDIQTAFLSKTYPSLDSISDQDIQNAFNDKRLSKTHMRLLFLQSMADIQRTTSFKNAHYDQKITMVFGVIDKHLTKLGNAARQVDAKHKGARLNDAMIQEEKNFMANTRQSLEQKSPKAAIIDALKNLLHTTPQAPHANDANAPPVAAPNWMGSDTKPVETSLFPSVMTPQKNQQVSKNTKKKPDEKKEGVEKKILDGVKKFTEKVKNETTGGGGGLFGNIFSKLFG